MAQQFIPYAIIHQPRRLKLPAREIPAGASPGQIASFLFDEEMNRGYLDQVARSCYYPATRQFRRLLDEGFKLSLGISLSFVYQAERWEPELLERLRELVAHPNLELVGVEPYHGFLFYLDFPRFLHRMDWMRDELERIFGKRPVVTDTTELFMGNDLYYALKKGGWDATLIDGRERLLQGREPTHLYRYYRGPYLFCRHLQLSDDVGFRFSNRQWRDWPLLAGDYARWIAETPGEFVFVAWDYETFGEHHREFTGIFEFIEHLPGELSNQGVSCATLSEARSRYAEQAQHLPLPEVPVTWAGGGTPEFFLSNPAQQTVFQLMHHAYHKAVLTGHEELIDLAIWLSQSDNLHLIQWYGKQGPEADVSISFTPREWWGLQPSGIVAEIQAVYGQFIRALDRYLDPTAGQ